MKNLTPAHLRCGVSISCPSLLQLEDGRLLVVGKQAQQQNFRCTETGDWSSTTVVGDVPVGPSEQAVIIDPALLDVYVAEKVEALLAENDRNQRDWHNGFQRVQDWLSERDWWTEDDIDHEGNDPAQTLINGLERKEHEKAKSQWQTIDTAPKDGTEIMGYREDSGPILVRYCSMRDFMLESEIEAEERAIGRTFSEEELDAESWFFADFVQGGRLCDDEAPTHWMPLPLPPVSEG